MRGAHKNALRVGFDQAIELEFQGTMVSSDDGSCPCSDLDQPAQLTESDAVDLFNLCVVVPDALEDEVGCPKPEWRGSARCEGGAS